MMVGKRRWKGRQGEREGRTTPAPFFVHFEPWSVVYSIVEAMQLVLRTSGINGYSLSHSTEYPTPKLLVSGGPSLRTPIAADMSIH